MELISYPVHSGFQRLVRDLNRIYVNHKALYYEEYDPIHFKWIKADNADQSVYVFKREVEDECFLFIFNMTPNFYNEYRIGVPYKGTYEEIFNSDKDVYGGANQYNGAPLIADDILADYCYNSIVIKLASFGACIFKLTKKDVVSKKVVSKKEGIKR